MTDLAEAPKRTHRLIPSRFPPVNAFETVASPEDLAAVFELEGWSVAELADLTGKSVANIKVRLMRARRKMRDRLVRFFEQSATQELTQLYASEEGLCAVTKPGKK